jgi:hypothetical protein
MVKAGLPIVLSSYRLYMNKQGQFSAFGICLLVLLLVNNSSAQGCCGIGGSLVSGGYPVLDKNTILASVSGNYADAKKPDERHRGGSGVMLAYGITDRLSLSLKTSYIWATYSKYMPPIIDHGVQIYSGKTVNYKNNGLGDVYTAVQFALIRLTPMNKQELITGMDVGIPLGPYENKVDGVVLPGNVQTGTGGFSVNGFLTYLKAFPTIYYAVTSTIAGRVNFTTLHKNEKKDPGDEFSVMLTSLFGPFYNTRGSITFIYYRKGQSFDKDNIPIDKAPSKRFSFVPALEYSIVPDMKLSINADIPLWRNEAQKIYGNDKVLRAEFYWFIHASSTSPQIKTIFQ